MTGKYCMLMCDLGYCTIGGRHQSESGLLGLAWRLFYVHTDLLRAHRTRLCAGSLPFSSCRCPVVVKGSDPFNG